jgi:acyl-coenzyme A thioesterase PaaI-like protein
VPFSEKLTQQQRYFHGAVAGAIGDSAGGYAALSLAPEDREVLTVEYKINLLAPAWGHKWWLEGSANCRSEVVRV